jgi:hypothetical protein
VELRRLLAMDWTCRERRNSTEYWREISCKVPTWKIMKEMGIQQRNRL